MSIFSDLRQRLVDRVTAKVARDLRVAEMVKLLERAERSCRPHHIDTVSMMDVANDIRAFMARMDKWAGGGT